MVSFWTRHFGNSRPRACQLLLDLSVLYKHDAGTGIQRVVKEVARRLPQAVGDAVKVVPVYATKFKGYRYCDVKKLAHIVKFDQAMCPDKRVVVQSGDQFLGLDLAAHFLPRHARQVKAWRRRGVFFSVVVYDLLPHRMPEFFTDKTARNFAAWIRFLDRYCDKFICISQTVSEEVRGCFLEEFGSEKVVMSLRLGADLPVRENRLAYIPKELEGKRYVLMVGTIEPRKSYETALSAFEYIWQQVDNDLTLVIVGKPGWKSEHVQNRLLFHPELGQRMFWFDQIDDMVLDQLYRHANLLLIASKGEGFGLPVTEAIMRGTRVLGRDISVFREVGRSDADYFADDSPPALAKAICDCSRDGGRRREMHSVATWDDTVADLCALLSLNDAIKDN